LPPHIKISHNNPKALPWQIRQKKRFLTHLLHSNPKFVISFIYPKVTKNQRQVSTLSIQGQINPAKPGDLQVPKKTLKDDEKLLDLSFVSKTSTNFV
jgi:hypothetical protein